jgi:A/G-specific adenine glycosylase
MDWHSTANHRSLPWKEEKDPYRIWLSEIILQQTRALQGLPYYLAFTEAYPTIQDFAGAADEDVFRLWQGLGYYNRCKNMLATARFITNQLGGKFPDTHDGLLQLKGVGPYTAAAIASFAYGLPHAVVDGNVYRVLARYFGIDTPFDTAEGKKIFQSLASALLHSRDSAGYNQAIMDLGATVCTPATPLCHQCPLQKHCIACHNQLTNVLPARSKKPVVRTRHFHYVLLWASDKIWIRKRTGKDIWENLHEPYLVEHDAALDTHTLATQQQFINLQHIGASQLQYEGSLKQRLTHQLIETRFFSMVLPTGLHPEIADGMWVPVSELKNIAFPRTLVTFLEKNQCFSVS